MMFINTTQRKNNNNNNNIFNTNKLSLLMLLIGAVTLIETASAVCQNTLYNRLSHPGYGELDMVRKDYTRNGGASWNTKPLHTINYGEESKYSVNQKFMHSSKIQMTVKYEIWKKASGDNSQDNPLLAPHIAILENLQNVFDSNWVPRLNLDDRLATIEVYASCDGRNIKNGRLNIKSCESHIPGDRHFCFALGLYDLDCKETGVINNNHFTTYIGADYSGAHINEYQCSGNNLSESTFFRQANCLSEVKYDQLLAELEQDIEVLEKDSEKLELENDLLTNELTELQGEDGSKTSDLDPQVIALVQQIDDNLFYIEDMALKVRNEMAQINHLSVRLDKQICSTTLIIFNGIIKAGEWIINETILRHGWCKISWIGAKAGAWVIDKAITAFKAAGSGGASLAATATMCSTSAAVGLFAADTALIYAACDLGHAIGGSVGNALGDMFCGVQVLSNEAFNVAHSIMCGQYVSALTTVILPVVGVRCCPAKWGPTVDGSRAQCHTVLHSECAHWRDINNIVTLLQ